MLHPPDFSMDVSRQRMKEEKPGSYVVLCSRASAEDRSRIKYVVKTMEAYDSIENLYEDAIYKFYMEKPYVKGYTFLIPGPSVAFVRKTNLVARTGWRQINFWLNGELSDAVKDEVKKLKKFNPSVSVVSYLYTGLRWFLDRIERVQTVPIPQETIPVTETVPQKKENKKAEKKPVTKTSTALSNKKTTKSSSDPPKNKTKQNDAKKKSEK